MIYLSLENNRLRALPKRVQLPKLRALNPKGNALTTLPASLAEQPALEKLDLEGNPWASLPAAFNGVATVNLSIQDKRRLLDFRYQGADGQGLVQWDDVSYHAQGDADLRQLVSAVIADNALTDYADALRSTVKKAVGLVQTEPEDYSHVGNHRFGGMPDLPEGVAYPRFSANEAPGNSSYVYEFIAQLNCETLAPFKGTFPAPGCSISF